MIDTKKIYEDTTATATTGYYCQHRNGWLVTVKFWIFKKRVFVCSDCGSVYYYWNIPEKVGKQVNLDAHR